MESDVRVVVLASGLEKFFTAGLDCKSAFHSVTPSDWLDLFEISVESGLSAFNGSSVDAARTSFHLGRHVKEFQHAIGAPERCPFPVIVATHGVALGLAIDIIAACDVRYAASNTGFSIKVRPRSSLAPGR